jgi:hypothetical protein
MVCLFQKNAKPNTAKTKLQHLQWKEQGKEKDHAKDGELSSR